MRLQLSDIEGKSADDVLELLMDADVEVRDILEEEESVIIYAEPDQFHAVQEVLKSAGITEFNVAEITMLAQNDLTLSPEAQAQFEKMIDVTR